MKTLNCILVVVTANAAVAFGQTRPADPAQLARERFAKEFAEVRAIQQKHVSLEVDVATYCDLVLAGRSSASFGRVIERYGMEAAQRERVKQVRARNADVLIKDCLYASARLNFPFLRDLAVEYLRSPAPDLQAAAMNWCISTPEALNEQQRAEVIQLVKREFVKSGGQKYFVVIRDAATAADLPMVRQVFNTNFRKVENSEERSYNCTKALHDSHPTRSHFILLMARLGDPNAVKEIRDAIMQEDDVQRRCWGLYLAAHLRQPTLLSLVVAQLDDTRLCDEPIDSWGDPAFPTARRKRVARTRVCDLALRAAHHMSPPKDPLPFKVPSATEWTRSHGLWEQEFDRKDAAEPRWDTDVKIVVVDVTVGFTDEQLEIARKEFASRDNAPAPSRR
jgi:hypothetical protein